VCLEVVAPRHLAGWGHPGMSLLWAMEMEEQVGNQHSLYMVLPLWVAVQAQRDGALPPWRNDYYALKDTLEGARDWPRRVQDAALDGENIVLCVHFTEAYLLEKSQQGNVVRRPASIRMWAADDPIVLNEHAHEWLPLHPVLSAL